MKSINKQISNPFSTGGGGSNFETRVQAAFTVLMLTGGFAPCQPNWLISKIKLQGKYGGYETDDMIVFRKEPNGEREARLLAQVKHSIHITRNDPIFTEVIRAAWTDFNNPRVFRPNLDHLAIVTGPLTGTDMEVRETLEWARQREDANEFFTSVNMSNFSSSVKKEKLGVIRHHLDAASGGTLSDERVWEFLKSFHLFGYDLDIESGVIQSLLHSLIAQYEPGSAPDVWARVVDVVQTANQNAGTISVESVPADLRARFERKTAMVIPADLARRTSLPMAVAGTSFASDLAAAMLLGGWDEAMQGDIVVVAKVAGMEPAQWVARMRDALQEAESPLALRNGTWTVNRKGELWEMLGPRILDADLERFQVAAIEVLSRPDPLFEIPPDDRYFGRVQGKVMAQSETLRRGMADTLALLGGRPDALTHCTQGKPETIALLVVREVLDKADWALWGSLNDLLPLLAEAAPREFLDAVEKAQRHVPCPFAKLFEQEGKGIFGGGNHLTGLLWALESLAWDGEFLPRVTVILGGLATIDPGGNWANRPANSLTTIFLPWLPQTTAPVEKRQIAVQTLKREVPDSVWKLLLSLLPNQHQMSMGAHKPIWRRTIPEGWDGAVTHKQYHDEVCFYADMALEMAKGDPDKLPPLVEALDNLPPATTDGLLAHIQSEHVAGLAREQRMRVWSALTELLARHRRFPDAEWAVEPDFLEKMEKASQCLAPDSLVDLYRPLFTERATDFYELDDNWEAQTEKLARRRNDAVSQILASGGMESVLELASKAESPMSVGAALGVIAGRDIDECLLPGFLLDESRSHEYLIAGYVHARHREQGWPWVDGLNTSRWTAAQVGRLLVRLPFCHETWERVKTLLGPDEMEYWSKVATNPYGPSGELREAAVLLIQHGRPNAAIDCLYGEYRGKHTLDHGLVIKALLFAVATTEPPNSMRLYHAIELIKALQDDPGTDPQAICSVEWAYLPALDDHRKATPRSLERFLASDPNFFCDVIRRIFRSRNQTSPQKEPTEQEKQFASNAYRLLHKWRVSPGVMPDGGFSVDRFRAWLETVRSACRESGHLEVAQVQVGQVLARNIPPGEDGLWINKAVAEALNASDAEDMRRGLCTGFYNLRGFHAVDPTGAPEKELAAKFRQRADDVERLGYHRLADSLRQLADSYMDEAKRIVEEHSARAAQ